MLRTAHVWALVIALVGGFVGGMPRFVFAIGTGSVTGTVTDKTTGQPLACANVLVLGTDRGAMVLDNGRFTVDKIPPGSYAVKVSMIGYRTASRKPSRGQPASSKLSPADR